MENTYRFIFTCRIEIFIHNKTKKFKLLYHNIFMSFAKDWIKYLEEKRIIIGSIVLIGERN